MQNVIQKHYVILNEAERSEGSLRDSSPTRALARREDESLDSSPTRALARREDESLDSSPKRLRMTEGSE